MSENERIVRSIVQTKCETSVHKLEQHYTCKYCLFAIDAAMVSALDTKDAEIRRLMDELADFKQGAQVEADEADRLRKENAALKEALEQINRQLYTTAKDKLRSIIKAALEGGK